MNTQKIFLGHQGKTFKDETFSCLRGRTLCIFLFILGILYIVFSIGRNSKTVRENSEEKISKTEVIVTCEHEQSLVPIMDPYDIKEFNQTDLRLLNYLRSRHLTPPSKLAYNFNEARYDPGGDINVIARLKKIFKSKTGGFFLEVGAFDGVGSNTLFFEMVLNWSGLLIECHPTLIPELKRAHRKAYIADVCISTTDRPSMVKKLSVELVVKYLCRVNIENETTEILATEIISAKGDFNQFPGSSSLRDDNFFKRIKTPTQKFEVQTVPLFSILAALQIKVVDFVILDVQGIELKVLKNFPFNSVLVKVWVVEHTEHTAEEKIQIIEIMVKNGYKNHEDLGGDYLFVHDSIQNH